MLQKVICTTVITVQSSCIEYSIGSWMPRMIPKGGTQFTGTVPSLTDILHNLNISSPNSSLTIPKADHTQSVSTKPLHPLCFPVRNSYRFLRSTLQGLGCSLCRLRCFPRSTTSHLATQTAFVMLSAISASVPPNST